MWKNSARSEYIDGVPSDLRSSFTDFDVIGGGTYGTVYRAHPKIGGPMVALKKIKLHTNERVISMSLPATAMREILILRELAHPNVVALRDVYFKPLGLSLWLWFDHCPLDLRVLIKFVHKAQTAIAAQQRRGGLPPGGLDLVLVKRFAQQLFEGMAFVHGMNIIHRDLKPQNILMHDKHGLKSQTVGAGHFQPAGKLLSSGQPPPTFELSPELRKALLCFQDVGATCVSVLEQAMTTVAQIADFGLSRSAKVYYQHLTHEVITLWYRAPEILLGCEIYTNSIDVWSLGCIVAEMISGRPLFPGDSEVDTLFKIFKLLGTPKHPTDLGYNSLSFFQDAFPRWTVTDTNRALSEAIFRTDKPPNPLVIDLIGRCLRFNPNERMSCEELLSHVFFRR